MNLFTPAVENEIIPKLLSDNIESGISHIHTTLIQLYNAIPDNKRISYGRVHVIKILSQLLFEKLVEVESPVFSISKKVFEQSTDYWSAGVGLGLISFCGLDDFESALPYFENAAASESWDVREFTQMFFRKLIKKYPDEMHTFLSKLSESKNARMRRFVAETLRPVQENQWFYRNPEFSLGILRKLFSESSAYPRTAVGNNLSDLARRLPELVFGIAEELVESGDKNSYWIAYRACRNLVKTQPIWVMDILKVDEYTYKNRIHRRRDYS